MPTSAVYLIAQNNEPFNRYVGSSVHVDRRWHVHRCLLRSGKHHSAHLQAAWNKYGEHSFDFFVLERCKPSELLGVEQFFIDLLTPSLNHGPAAAPTRGRTLSAETKAKISAARLGRKLSEEFRAVLSAAHRGRSLSERHRASIAAAMKRPETVSRLKARPQCRANGEK